MEYLPIKDLKEGQTVWFCPLQLKKSISISTNRTNMPIDSYYPDSLECTVTSIDRDRGTVDIVVKDRGYTPYNWCRDYGTTRDMTSFLFETKEIARRERKTCVKQIKEFLLDRLSGMMCDIDYYIDRL